MMSPRKAKNPDSMRTTFIILATDTKIHGAKANTIKALKEMVGKDPCFISGGINVKVEALFYDQFKIKTRSNSIANGLKDRDYVLRTIQSSYGLIENEIIEFRFYKRSKAVWERYCIVQEGERLQSRVFKPFNSYENYVTIQPYIHYSIVPCAYYGEYPWWYEETEEGN